MTTNTEHVRDVHSEPPARRHELIFDTYYDLRPGDGFVRIGRPEAAA